MIKESHEDNLLYFPLISFLPTPMWFFSLFLSFICLLYTQCGPGTHHPKIKSHSLPTEPARRPQRSSVLHVLILTLSFLPVSRNVFQPFLRVYLLMTNFLSFVLPETIFLLHSRCRIHSRRFFFSFHT